MEIILGKKKDIISANFLDYIPQYGKNIEFKISKDGEVTILTENKGIANKVAQKFFHKPKVSNIHLDKMGNFIWPLIDGKKSILDISVLVKEKFGAECEPLYDRLATYFRNLESYDFVEFVNKKND